MSDVALSEDEKRNLLYADDYRLVLKTEAGRRVLLDILRFCSYGKSAFAGDTNATMWLAGKQSVAEQLKDIIDTVAPEAYGLMLKQEKEQEYHDRSDPELNRGGSPYTERRDDDYDPLSNKWDV